MLRQVKCHAGLKTQAELGCRPRVSLPLEAKHATSGRLLDIIEFLVVRFAVQIIGAQRKCTRAMSQWFPDAPEVVGRGVHQWSWMLDLGSLLTYTAILPPCVAPRLDAQTPHWLVRLHKAEPCVERPRFVLSVAVSASWLAAPSAHKQIGELAGSNVSEFAECGQVYFEGPFGLACCWPS